MRQPRVDHNPDNRVTCYSPRRGGAGHFCLPLTLCHRVRPESIFTCGASSLKHLRTGPMAGAMRNTLYGAPNAGFPRYSPGDSGGVHRYRTVIHWPVTGSGGQPEGKPGHRVLELADSRAEADAGHLRLLHEQPVVGGGTALHDVVGQAGDVAAFPDDLGRVRAERSVRGPGAIPQVLESRVQDRSLERVADRLVEVRFVTPAFAGARSFLPGSAYLYADPAISSPQEGVPYMVCEPSHRSESRWARLLITPACRFSDRRARAFAPRCGAAG